MSFFQNPFTEDWRGIWVLGDRHHQPTFICPRNSGRDDELIISWADDTFDLSGNDSDGDASDTLKIRFAIFPEFRRWAQLSIDVTTAASNTAAVTHAEIVTSLNDDAQFAGWFTASQNAQNGRTQIRSRRDSAELRFYIENGQAEESLRFNAKSGVAELPTYFDRHKVVHLLTAAEITAFRDNMNQLIPLDPGANNVDAAVIDDNLDAYGKSTGLDSGTVRADWQLLKGQSGIFTFQNITVDGSDRITEIIEYSAGAAAGALARKIEYSYTGANKNPDQITEIPHTLESGDLVTP